MVTGLGKTGASIDGEGRRSREHTLAMARANMVSNRNFVALPPFILLDPVRVSGPTTDGRQVETPSKRFGEEREVAFTRIDEVMARRRHALGDVLRVGLLQTFNHLPKGKIPVLDRVVPRQADCTNGAVSREQYNASSDSLDNHEPGLKPRRAVVK